MVGDCGGLIVLPCFLRSEYIGTKLNMPLLKNRIAGYVGVVATLLP